MCGISGFNFTNQTLIEQMNSVQAHRGPDGEGIFTDENVSLGHKRLAIIDLSKQANQPLFYKHFIIIFNGEIYNYIELRNQLIKKNHFFRTNSDTEVILHAYEEWGVNCVNHFNGMWAFCIYDKNKEELFISRDRFGIKPLFYYFNKEKFIFASEIKAIQCHKLELSISKKALNYYLYQKYIGQNQTIFNEVKKLNESHYLLFNLKNQQIKIRKYYDLKNEIKKLASIGFGEKKSRIHEIIQRAVENRLIADVPVGSFLSGGIDSSLISSLISKNHSQFDVFSIGFEEETFNELNYAKMVANKLNVNHHYKTLTINEDFIFGTLEKLDEPFGDPSLLPTSLLSKMTSEKVTVCLSGDAGDEVFGGYDTYLAWKLAQYIPGFIMYPLKRISKLFPASDKNLHFTYKIKKFIQDWDSNVQKRHLNWMSQTTDNQRKNLLNNHYVPIDSILEFSGEKSLLSIQLNDFKNYLSNDILRKVDIASMMFSLETRVPFLDYRLVPYVLSLSKNYKIHILKTKYFLKKYAAAFLPKRIINRKKAGFSIPLALWFKQSERMKEIIENKMYYQHNFFDYGFVQLQLKEHLTNKSDNSRLLWLILVFNYWYAKQNNDLEIK